MRTFPRRRSSPALEARHALAEESKRRAERDRAERARWVRAEGPCPADVWGQSETVASFDWLEGAGGYATHVRRHATGDYLMTAGACGGWEFTPVVQLESAAA